MRFPTRGHPDIDPTSMHPLLEESGDIHRDAMAATTSSLAEMVELGNERRGAGIEPGETSAFVPRRNDGLTGAFNTAITQLNGKQQTAPDPRCCRSSTRPSPA